MSGKIYRLLLVVAVSSFLIPITSLMCQSVGTQQIKNLRAFAKLYGYVRFFHPSDESANLDWDKFAVLGAENILNAKDDQELKETLKKLFLPIAPTAQILGTNEKPLNRQSLVIDTSKYKLTYWQHLSYGGTTEYYRSVRVNSRNLVRRTAGNNSSGILTQHIDAKPYRGKEIILSAFVKADVKNSADKGYLWLRVDRENKQVGYFDIMGDRPIVDREWKEYQIKGQVADDASNIFFGGMVDGSANIWFDEFTLLYKNENNEWVPVKIANSGFEEKADAKDIEGWRTSSTGYSFLLDNKNVKLGNSSLLVKADTKEVTIEKIFDSEVKAADTIAAEISDGIKCIIPMALYCDSTGTLGKNENYKMDFINSGIEKIKFTPKAGDDLYVRLGNTMTAWNIFRHFYPYFDVVSVDWDKVLSETLLKALKNKTADEFNYTLREMVAKLQDGHGVVYYSPSNIIGTVPVKTDWIENQLVITGSQDTLFKKGDIIKSLDGKTGEGILKETEMYVSGSPQLRRYRALNEVCDGPLGSKAKFVLSRNNKDIIVESVRGNKGGNLFCNSITEFNYPSIKKYDNGIYYINVMTMSSKEFSGNIEDLSKADGIIFDLRYTAKSQSANQADLLNLFYILPHLLSSRIEGVHMYTPQVIYPDNKYNSFKESKHTFEPMGEKFNGKFVFLTEPCDVSICESFLSPIRYHHLGEIVGSTSAGTNGDVNYIILPGGYTIMWTGMKVLNPDNSQHHLIGVKPDYPVERTIKAVKEGRDEYLEKAFEVLKNKIK